MHVNNCLLHVRVDEDNAGLNITPVKSSYIEDLLRKKYFESDKVPTSKILDVISL